MGVLERRRISQAVGGLGGSLDDSSHVLDEPVTLNK